MLVGAKPKAVINITNTLSIDPAEIEEKFIRSPGAGGQNVNKVATAVQLRFNARRCKALSNALYLRLAKIAGSKLNKDGVIVITASKHRSQDRNRQEALDRLIDLIRQASPAPKRRRPTKPSRAAKAKRVETKKQRGATKKNRGRVTGEGYWESN